MNRIISSRSISMLVGVIIVQCISSAVTFAAEEKTAGVRLEGWYQVDVILFKPRNTDLDEEGWPEFDASYPQDVISVTEPRPFQLSQLQQLGEQPDELPPEEIDVLGSDEFLFESQSLRNRNRRVMESITGVGTTQIEDEVANAETEQEIPVRALSEPMPESESPATELIAEPELPEADPYAPGTLAFSRTDDESSLLSILRSLRRSSRFTVLDHYSWIQPIDNEPTAIMMQTGQRYDDRYEIEGTLSFSRSRFLHVHTNLWYTHFEPRGGNTEPFLKGFDSSLSDEMLNNYSDLTEVEQQRGLYYPARMHKMVQSRRMRSDELHYLDHPLFGVVVRINRYEPVIETQPSF